MPILRTRINFLKAVDPNAAKPPPKKKEEVEQLPVHKIALLLPLVVILVGKY